MAEADNQTIDNTLFSLVTMQPSLTLSHSSKHLLSLLAVRVHTANSFIVSKLVSSRPIVAGARPLLSPAYSAISDD